MKKYPLILLLLYFQFYSQPILINTDFTTFSVNTYTASAIGLSPGNSGINQIWDFSNVPYENTISYSLQTVESSNTPFVSSFPLTNYVQKVTITIDNFNYEAFSLSKISSSGIELLASTTATAIEEDFTPNTLFIPLPFSYNSSYSDTFQSTTDATLTTRVNFYDGYGTLITPFGTFNNVIRIKQTDDGDDIYNWIAVNPYRPLMFGQFTPNGSITFCQNTNLSTNAVTYNKKLFIFPNPVKAILNIEFTNFSIDKIVVNDALGKIVLQKSRNTNQINVESLASGIYTIQIFSENHIYHKKFIKE